MGPQEIHRDRCGSFEQGPIRPPSEAGSLLLRVSRNCPWNRCTFCPLYRNQEFSLRPLVEVLADIDAVAAQVRQLGRAEKSVLESPGLLRAWHDQLPGSEQAPFRAAVHWLQNGQEAVFLQDADGLAGGYERMLKILRHLRRQFPQIGRITCYSRSTTVIGYSEAQLRSLGEAGLNRLHLGMESGSDRVLRRVRKGATQKAHIEAGQRLRRAGMELSLYLMPGLGGRDLSREHALQSAAALNRIDPHFIRLRTLAVPPGTPLAEDLAAGRFIPCDTADIVAELNLFIEALEGIHSVVVSDHVLNLFEDLGGRLPEEKEAMLAMLAAFAKLDPEQRRLYLLGRAAGCFRGLQDLHNPLLRAEAENLARQLDVTEENLEAVCGALRRRYI